MVDGDPEDLVQSAVHGDRLALEELLFVHHDRLLARIGRRFPASLRGAISEEDVLQETLAAAFRDIASFEPRGRWSFYRWLCRIGDCRITSEIRHHSAEKRGGGRARVSAAWDADSCAELIELMAGPRRTPSRSVAAHEAAHAIHVGLASLGDDRRQALALRYQQGLPVAEVAKAMSRTPRAIHNLCHKGLKELRAVLGRSEKYLTRT